MKTQDGYEYQHGRKYWYVSVDKLPGWLKEKPQWEPFKDWCMPELEPILGKKLFVFHSNQAAHDFIESKRPEFDKEGIDYRAKLIDIVNTLSKDSCEDLVQVLEELEKAQKKHPVFPTDIFERLAKVNEEALEFTQAVNDVNEGNGTYKEVESEVLQLCAVSLRFKNNLIETKTVD